MRVLKATRPDDLEKFTEWLYCNFKSKCKICEDREVVNDMEAEYKDLSDSEKSMFQDLASLIMRKFDVEGTDEELARLDDYRENCGNPKACSHEEHRGEE